MVGKFATIPVSTTIPEHIRPAEEAAHDSDGNFVNTKYGIAI